MNSVLANIWNHPKTSVAGLLIAIVTIAGVLSQQGITFGNLGTGTVISLVTALATALLGLLARDPGAATAPSAGSTAKLGAWMLVAVLLMGTMTGCSATTVAQDIVNWTPALQSAVAVVDSTAAVLDPAAAPIFVAATAGFDVASNALVVQAKAYLANPGAGVLATLQSQVVTFQQQVNSALLAAVKIVNPASQQKAMADINAVATVINAMLALVLSISSKAAAAGMAAAAKVKIASIEPYIDRVGAAYTLAAHYDGAADFSGVMTSGSFGAGSAALSMGIEELQADGF